MTRKSFVGLALAAGVLAGCSGVGLGTITYVDNLPYYDPTMVQYVAAQGQVPLAVYGRAFDGDKSQTDRELAAILQLPGHFPPAPFVPTADAAAGKGPRMVMLLDPEGHPANMNKVCENAAALPTSQTRGPAIQVQALFCYGDEPVSHAVLTTARPQRVDDPAFGNQLAVLLIELLPSRSPNAGGDCPLMMGNC